jgi:hypothetical protein
MNEAKTNLTLKQRQRMQGKVQSEQKPEKQGSGKELPRIVAILLLLLAFGGGTALGMIYFRPDPRLQEMDDMMAIAMDPLTPDDMRGMLMGESGELNAQLPANMRRGRGMMRDPDERDMAMAPKFLAMSAADQLARLEKMAADEKEREARRAEREAEAAANAADKPADSSKGDGSSNNGNGNGGGRGGKNDQQKVQRQEQGLANHPPQQRAQGGLMRQMINAVRQQASR